MHQVFHGLDYFGHCQVVEDALALTDYFSYFALVETQQQRTRALEYTPRAFYQLFPKNKAALSYEIGHAEVKSLLYVALYIYTVNCISMSTIYAILWRNIVCDDAYITWLKNYSSLFEIT